jgi:hypothetical protein
MSRNNNYYNNRNNNGGKSAGAVPDFLLNKARGEKEVTKREFDLAKERIPDRYYDFLVLLDQNVKLNDNQYEMTPEARKIGMFSFDKGTYVKVSKPYVTVDGRIQMARDEHKEAKAKLHIHPYHIEQVGDKNILSVTVESEIYGSSTGAIEIGSGGGVDTKNPIANAQTSAIGRALGFLGYGLVGTGVIASADEIRSANIQTDHSSSVNGQQQSPQHNSNPTKSYRILLQSNPVFNQDGSCTCQARLESQDIVQLLVPVNFKNVFSGFKTGDVLQVQGWYTNNNKQKRLRLDSKSKPVVEKKAS